MNEHECVAPTPSNKEVVEAVRQICQRGSKAILSSVLLVLYHDAFSHNYLGDAQKKENFSRAANRALRNASKAGLIKYSAKDGWYPVVESLDDYPNLRDFVGAPFEPMRPIELSAESLRSVQQEGMAALAEIEELRAKIKTLASFAEALAAEASPAREAQLSRVLKNLKIEIPR